MIMKIIISESQKRFLFENHVDDLFSRKDESLFKTKLSKNDAKILLGLNDDENRPLENDLVDEYLNLMNQGKWKPNIIYPIGLSYYYKMLIDGQHRLTAFLKSKLPYLETYIKFG